MKIKMESSAFANNQPIPKKFTGTGDDVSPPLKWSDVPAGTKELALIVDDPDAPTAEPFVHWVMYKIPAQASGLGENIPKAEKPSNPPGALEGTNSWNKIGYGGPMPPPGHGVHHYHFTLYALSRPLNVKPGLDKESLINAMTGAIIDKGELVGTFQR
jgi:Raf kinase inhibitor-like YbhB/YbcL family protein